MNIFKIKISLYSLEEGKLILDSHCILAIMVRGVSTPKRSNCFFYKTWMHDIIQGGRCWSPKEGMHLAKITNVGTNQVKILRGIRFQEVVCITWTEELDFYWIRLLFKNRDNIYSLLTTVMFYSEVIKREGEIFEPPKSPIKRNVSFGTFQRNFKMEDPLDFFKSGCEVRRCITYWSINIVVIKYWSINKVLIKYQIGVLDPIVQIGFLSFSGYY